MKFLIKAIKSHALSVGVYISNTPELTQNFSQILPKLQSLFQALNQPFSWLPDTAKSTSRSSSPTSALRPSRTTPNFTLWSSLSRGLNGTVFSQDCFRIRQLTSSRLTILSLQLEKIRMTATLRSLAEPTALSHRSPLGPNQPQQQQRSSTLAQMKNIRTSVSTGIPQHSEMGRKVLKTRVTSMATFPTSPSSSAGPSTTSTPSSTNQLTLVLSKASLLNFSDSTRGSNLANQQRFVRKSNKCGSTSQALASSPTTAGPLTSRVVRPNTFSSILRQCQKSGPR